MFRMVSLVVFLFLIGWFVWYFRSHSSKFESVDKRIQKSAEDFGYAITHLKSISSRDFSEKLLLPLFWICVLLLAVSGFIPAVILGAPLTGYLLILHVTVAPLFALVITVMAVLWSIKYQFNQSDWKHLKGAFTRKSRPAAFYQSLAKALFWLLLLLAIPVMLSILISMFTLFGTDGQFLLLNIHRYSTLSLVVVTLFYIFSIYRAREKS